MTNEYAASVADGAGSTGMFGGYLCHLAVHYWPQLHGPLKARQLCLYPGFSFPLSGACAQSRRVAQLLAA